MLLIKLSKQTMGLVILTLAGLFSPLSSMAAVIDVSGVKYEDVIDQRGSNCLLYTSPSPRDRTRSRMPSSA